MTSTLLSTLREFEKNESKHSNPMCSMDSTFSSLPLQPFISPALPSYLNKYPEIVEAVQGVKELVDEWKEETGVGGYELEARLGKFTLTGFKPGVSCQFMENVIIMLKSYKKWSSETDWEETHDYYYKTDETNLPMVRTTSSFIIDKVTGRRRIGADHIRKHVKRVLDYKYHSSTPASFQHNYDLRVNLSFEEVISRENLPTIVNPSFMRIKCRKSFYYTSEQFPSSVPIWKLDLTRSWSGASKSEAELRQKTEEPVYEIEIECINPLALMISPKHDTIYVACSLLLKMKDFVTEFSKVVESFKWIPVQKKMTATQEQIVTCF